MEFKTEICLVSSFKEKHLNLLHINNNLKILEEVKLGFGIADIVVGELSNISFSKETEALNAIDISIYNIIERNKKITIEAVSDITKCNKRQISNSLNKLICRSYIEKKDSYYLFTNKYELAFKKSIAIEVKLKNWRRALMQAYRYKWFADYSYVVLDHAHINPALKNIDLFKKYNIGLISLTSDGKSYSHISPKKENPIDTKMQILLSEAMLYL